MVAKLATNEAGVAPRTGSSVSARAGAWTASEKITLESRGYYPFRKILSKRLGKIRSESLRSRLSRLKKILNLDLHDSVQRRLCKLEDEALKRVSNFVESITDAVIFSTPDVTAREADFNRLLKWAYSIAVYRVDAGTRQWKSFGSLLKWFALRSQTAKPPNPSDLVGFGPENRDKFPAFWLKLCPWIGPIVDKGAETKLCLTRVAHLTSSRGLPPGDSKTRAQSLAKHRVVLTSAHEESEDRRSLLFNLSRLIGSKLKAEAQRGSAAHLSLTNSSSFDFSVKEGGRAAEISKDFRNWMESVPTKTREGLSVLGRKTAEIAGLPRWMTCCRKDWMSFVKALPRDKTGAFADEVRAGESRQDTFFDFLNFKYEDPLYGLDEVTGFQLHQWSIERMCELQLLAGDPHNPESLQLSAEAYALIRRSSIGEPGAKSRVVTVGEACITIFLQPFSHHLAGWLKQHPSARAGFTRAAQGFEYAKAVHSKEHPESGQLDLMMLSSDLTTATDYCVHSYSQAMLDGFCTGIGQLSAYHRLSNRLLCSPRAVVEGRGCEIWYTRRGILMGDPGAKCVLTLHNLCAELEAFLRFRSKDIPTSDLARRVGEMETIPSAWWRCFACAGDDHVATGPEEYLRGITRAHHDNGMSVSWSQNFVSRVGATYCEEFLLTAGYSSRDLFLRKFLWRLGYENHIHVDAIKLRLISPCSKEHEGKDEPNPGIGKSHQLSRVLSWLEAPVVQLRRWASRRFSDRFSALLSQGPERHLPVSLGGLAVPGWHVEPDELISMMADLPESHFHLIGKILSGESSHLERRIVSSFASNARARGLESDVIQDQVRQFLGNVELTKAINVDEIQSVVDVSPEEFQSWNFRKKLSAASAAGFISINDAINLIERPYIFRDLLFPDISEKHGYHPRSSSSYTMKSWDVRKRKFTEMVDKQVQEGECKTFSHDWVQRFAASLTSGDLLEIPPSNLLIPRDVVEVESRPQLRTPYY